MISTTPGPTRVKPSFPLPPPPSPSAVNSNAALIPNHVITTPKKRQVTPISIPKVICNSRAVRERAISCSTLVALARWIIEAVVATIIRRDAIATPMNTHANATRACSMPFCEVAIGGGGWGASAGLVILRHGCRPCGHGLSGPAGSGGFDTLRLT